MKVAIIAPIPNLTITRAGTIHLILAHLIKYPAYAQFYRNETKYKILDNGAFEGFPLPIEEVVKLAESVGANEIVLPDVMYAGKETIELIQKALSYLKEKGLIDKYKWMAVTQGKTEKEWLECFKALHEIPEINTIAINKLSTPLAFGGSTSSARLFVTELMDKNGWRDSGKEYHLLGGSNEIINEISKHPKWIRSIDSSAPIEYGRRMILLRDAKENLKTKIDFTRPALTNMNKNIIWRNIQDILEVANGN